VIPDAKKEKRKKRERERERERGQEKKKKERARIAPFVNVDRVKCGTLTTHAEEYFVTEKETHLNTPEQQRRRIHGVSCLIHAINSGPVASG
jgi:uncharacterized membrane-anchored protein